ncbi:hypothetical protein HanPI659440_Chr10g0372961 [Helianthus annuus]|nr:hypothetical protein HanPI659440_Chr10g0372961 [Helianthus annuus]
MCEQPFTAITSKPTIHLLFFFSCNQPNIHHNSFFRPICSPYPPPPPTYIVIFPFNGTSRVPARCGGGDTLHYGTCFW